MRRKDREIGYEETVKVLETAEYGVLSTVDALGNPYGVPMSFVFVDGCVYFHSAYKGHKIDNIRNNNRVCFSVTGKTEILPEKFTTNYESAIVFGFASETEGEEKYSALLAFITKYSSKSFLEGTEYIENMAERASVYKIIPVEITGKARRG